MSPIHITGCKRKGLVPERFGKKAVVLKQTINRIKTPGRNNNPERKMEFFIAGLCGTQDLTICRYLAIRIQLRPFGPAFARLMAQGPDAAGDQAIQRSIAACIPYVVSIWILLLLSAATGLHWLNP